MERTKKTNLPAKEVKAAPVEEVRIRYRKIGGGSLHLKNRLIKPNEIFLAYPSEIKEAFRDTVIPLEEEPKRPMPKVEPLPKPAVKSAYTLKARGKSRLLFDVVDAQGKILNEKVLTKTLAEQLIAGLNK